MVWVQLLFTAGAVAVFPCMGYPAAAVQPGEVVWRSCFGTPSCPQGVVARQVFYNLPFREAFGSNYIYPLPDYQMRTPDDMQIVWTAAPSDGKARTKRAISQRADASGEHTRVKRFFSPYMFGGFPGMMMGGYGTGMTSASAAAASGSYGSFGYPFMG